MRLTFNKLKNAAGWMAAALILAGTGCRKAENGGAGGTGEIKAGKFTILGTRTDNGDALTAKQNAENALQLYPDLDGMIGLYGYNPPQCLEALREAQRNGRDVLGKVKIFGFDGLPETLNGIEQGHIDGTVVQQPFEFGYQSMKILKTLNEGGAVESNDGVVDIPVKVITKDTVAAYRQEIAGQLEFIKNAAPPAPGAPKFAFVSNNQSSFWEEARAGCFKAQAELGVAVDFQMPDAQDAVAQNRILESLIQRGEVKGVAVSVISPDSQGDILKQIADKMPLITHDSDAPNSARKLYLGTNNYDAGRALGKQIKAALPDGGKLMIFVGSMDAVNARERQRGLVDELSAP